jgi:putative hemolysin
MDIILYSIALVICFVLSAFFSSSETAFTSLGRARIRSLEEGKAITGGVKELARSPEKYLSTVLVGNNLVNTAAAALGTVIAIWLVGEEMGVLAATLGVTIILLIFCEVTPKTFAFHRAPGVFAHFAGAIGFFSHVFSPFVLALGFISSQLLKLVGVRGGHPRSLISEEEIHSLISLGQEEGAVEEEEANLLHRVFEFGDRMVDEVMTPRTEVVFLEKGVTLSQFWELFSQFPYSRFPVYEENTDNIVGIISIKDVALAQAHADLSLESSLDDLLRPAFFVPQTKRIGELFSEMKSQRIKLAVVVDEYGGTAGMVTLEELLEVLVGEIEDELDRKEKDFEAITENTFEVDGSMRIEELNQQLGLELPEGNYETMAGFVLYLLGHIPKEGERIEYDSLNIIITQMKGLKVEKVLLTKTKMDAEA